MPDIAPEDRLLTPAETAAVLKKHRKTITRWASDGKIAFVRTLGGHRRYRESEVRALLAAGGPRPKPRRRKARDDG